MKVDLILKNGKYLDVKSRKFINGNIAIKDGKILNINYIVKFFGNYLII